MQELQKILEEMDNCIEEARDKFRDNEDNEAYRLYISVMNLAKTIICNHMSGKDTDVPANAVWIPVEERLPKSEDEKVIVCSKYGHIDTGIYSPYSKQWIIGNMSALSKNIIAWRSLPEIYHLEED